MVARKYLEALRANLSGTLLEPGQPAYAQSLVIDNGRITLQPSVVVMAADEHDVATAYKFAIEHHMNFTVKGGGHSGTGYCLNQNGMVIDLSQLTGKRLNTDKGTIWAQTGNRWRDLYLYLQSTNTGYIPIGGGCPTVGIPGFTLGGGISFVSRSYGLSVDNLLSIDIVTPDGKFRTISRDSTGAEADLFWACSGGGGGNFGIATAFTLRVHRPPTEKMLCGQIRYPIQYAPEILGFYNEWIETVPDRLAVYGYMGKAPEPAHPDILVNSVGLTPIFNGSTDEGMDLIAPILKFKNISINLFYMSLPDFEIYNGLLTVVGGRSAYLRSGFMAPKSMTQPAIDVMVRSMTSAPSPYSLMVWSHLGGKVQTVAPTATSYWHRQSRFLYEVKAIWSTSDQLVENVNWAYQMGEELEPHCTGAYVNYIDPLLSDWQTKFYGDNYERLCRVKEQWDPDHHFRFQQAIGSPFNPSAVYPPDLSPLFRTNLD